MLKMDLVGRKERGRLHRSLIDVVKKDTQMDDDDVRDRMRWRHDSLWQSEDVGFLFFIN